MQRDQRGLWAELEESKAARAEADLEMGLEVGGGCDGPGTQGKEHLCPAFLEMWGREKDQEVQSGQPLVHQVVADVGRMSSATDIRFLALEDIRAAEGSISRLWKPKPGEQFTENQVGETPSLQAPHADTRLPTWTPQSLCWDWKILVSGENVPPPLTPQSRLCVPLEEATPSSPAGRPMALGRGPRDVGRSWNNCTEQDACEGRRAGGDSGLGVLHSRTHRGCLAGRGWGCAP